MNDRQIHGHLSAEAMQALLDGELPEGTLTEVEEHLASCARCSAELDGWRLLYQGIEELPTLAPGAGFAERVIAGIDAEPLSWAARIRARLSPAATGSRHPDEGRLQDFVEGFLPARHAARIRTHVGTCASCASRVESWRSVVGALDRLDRFAPSEGFAARVMAEVRVPEPVAVVQRAPEWRGALAWARRRLVPHTRKAWATVSGIALTPAVTLSLVLWTIFTHPTLTPGALFSFALWKAADFGAMAWNALAAQAMQSSQVFGVFSFFQSLALSPAMLGGVFLTFSAGTVAAAWVLYRNLSNTHPTDGHYAHAPLS